MKSFIAAILCAGVLAAAYAGTVIFIWSQEGKPLTVVCVKATQSPQAARGRMTDIALRPVAEDDAAIDDCLRLLTEWPKRAFTLNTCIVVALLFALCLAVRERRKKG